MTTLKKTGIKGTELKNYPFRTKFILPKYKDTYPENLFFYLNRDEDGRIMPAGPYIDWCYDYPEESIAFLLIQDNIEVYDEPKPERVYMDRYEALKLVYEEGAKVAYDDMDWIATCGNIHINNNGRLDARYTSPSYALGKIFDQKKWFRVEE